MQHPVVIGHGPIHVIALHGWFGSASAWAPFTAMVDTGRFTYAFADDRGYGFRKDEAGQYTMAEIAADALALADQLGWDRFHLLGHSMGGKAIQRVLADAPTRVQRMVAVTPVPASGVPLDAQTRAFFESAATSREAREGIIFETTGSRLSKAWVAKMVQHSLDHSTEQAFAAYFHAWADGDFSSEIAGNEIAVKVIVGEHDPALTADVMKATFLKSYPNAELEVMRNAGHYPMDETPVALATSVERFLSQQG